VARDLACAALGWALAAAFWLGASRLPRSLLSDDFGAEGLPQGLAIVLAAVSTVIAARALYQNRGRRPFPAEKNARSSPREKEADPGFSAHAKAVGIVALGFAYVALAPLIGYLAACALIIFATGLYYGARASATLAAVSVAGAALLWLVFARMLSVSMPAGFWSQLF
jgi:putative tricarboxylic transport membrane protein